MILLFLEKKIPQAGELGLILDADVDVVNWLIPENWRTELNLGKMWINKNLKFLAYLLYGILRWPSSHLGTNNLTERNDKLDVRKHSFQAKYTSKLCLFNQWEDRLESAIVNVLIPSNSLIGASHRTSSHLISSSLILSIPCHLDQWRIFLWIQMINARDVKKSVRFFYRGKRSFVLTASSSSWEESSGNWC